MHMRWCDKGRAGVAPPAWQLCGAADSVHVHGFLVSLLFQLLQHQTRLVLFN